LKKLALIDKLPEILAELAELRALATEAER
jgi:hypothetical protein